MRGRTVIAGLLGGLVLLACTFVVNGLLGFNARFAMKQLPAEREVYEVLRNAVTEPGRYLCNPALTPEGRFPDNEPVFGVQYAGIGHEAAGLEAGVGLLIFLAGPLIGAWLLALTAERFRARFLNRVVFFVAIGLLLALTGDLKGFGIGASPLSMALLFAARTVATWAVVGLAVAAVVRPAPVVAAAAERAARA